MQDRILSYHYLTLILGRLQKNMGMNNNINLGCIHCMGGNYPTYTMYTQDTNMTGVYMAKSVGAMHKARVSFFFCINTHTFSCLFYIELIRHNPGHRERYSTFFHEYKLYSQVLAIVEHSLVFIVIASYGYQGVKGLFLVIKR